MITKKIYEIAKSFGVEYATKLPRIMKKDYVIKVHECEVDEGVFWLNAEAEGDIKEVYYKYACTSKECFFNKKFLPFKNVCEILGSVDYNVSRVELYMTAEKFFNLSNKGE